MLDQLKNNLVYLILGILAFNVVVLDYFMFVSRPRSIVQNISLGQETNTASPSSAVTTTNGQTIQTAPAVANACPNTCLTAIKTATESLKLTQNVTNNTTTTQQITSGGQEYFVPFGGASGASQGSFTTLSALQSYINMSNYTNVSSVVFEVSITGSGIAQAQLYNATDGYAIPNSQVSTPGGNPQLLISQPLTLPQGNKLYQVQIQTQLSNPATINSARLHITLK